MRRGKPDGLGKKKNIAEEWEYEGYFTDGQRDGFGTFRDLRAGITYIGEFKFDRFKCKPHSVQCNWIVKANQSLVFAFEYDKGNEGLVIDSKVTKGKEGVTTKEVNTPRKMQLDDALEEDHNILNRGDIQEKTPVAKHTRVENNTLIVKPGESKFNIKIQVVYQAESYPDPNPPPVDPKQKPKVKKPVAPVKKGTKV